MKNKHKGFKNKMVVRNKLKEIAENLAYKNRKKLSKYVRYCESFLRLYKINYELEFVLLRLDINSFYILDIYLTDYKIAIEIDDPFHEHLPNCISDIERDKHILEHYKINTFRFTHYEIDSNITFLHDFIKKISH